MNANFISNDLNNTGTGTRAKAVIDKFNKSMASIAPGLNVFREATTVLKTDKYRNLLIEAAKLDIDPTSTKQQTYDIQSLNVLQENVGRILNEAVQSIADISPIVINSFGIQERALIGSHMVRAVKQVTAKTDNFKLSERKPYVIDLQGNRAFFVDAFKQGSKFAKNVSETVEIELAVPSSDINLYSVGSVDKERIFDFISEPKSFEIYEADGTTKIAQNKISYVKGFANTLINVETGDVSFSIEYIDNTPTKHVAHISGNFDFSNGLLRRLSTTDPAVKKIVYSMVLSPETHHNAIRVGYEMKHNNVYIPIGQHYEYSLSEEFKDAADKYYNVDAMAMMTEYIGRAIEQIKDMVTLEKFDELSKLAQFNGKFNCKAPTGFTQGDEEHIRRQFNPYMEKVALILKAITKIEDCHFRVIGNPMDIRVADVPGTEYITKRNEEYVGNILMDYDFSVTSAVHKIFYLSTERIPQGKAYMFLIPNNIENNISTVNHYEYATYVSPDYRSPKSNLPTTMVSTRYLTKEYFPVMATITFVDNQPETAA